MKTIDYEDQQEITCPHCGRKNRNSWECGMTDGDEDVVECGKCGNGFVVRAIVYRTFSSRKLDKNKDTDK